MRKLRNRALFVSAILSLLITTGLCEQAPTSLQDTPSEFRATDAAIQALLDDALKASNNGNYSQATEVLQRALAQCNSRHLIADKSIVEDRLAAVLLTQGRMEDAKKQWLGALEDSTESSQSAVEIEVMVAMSSLDQASGHLTEALNLTTKAVDLARKDKNLYLLSRCLGELARFQLLAGKKTEARAAIDEALQIDRLNKYPWEPEHLLYSALASVADSESNFDAALETTKKARQAAIQADNYFVFIQASAAIAQAYIYKGNVSAGIKLLEQTQSATSDNGTPLFTRPDAYKQVMNAPLMKVIFLEAMASAYKAGQRPDDALKCWQELYDTASSTGFVLAAAEASGSMAEIYSTKKDYDKAVTNYARAADAWHRAGNEQLRTAALTSQASLLFTQGKKEEAAKLDEIILPLAKADKNVRLQFIVDLGLAESLDGTDKRDRVSEALTEAESLLTPALTLDGVSPSFVLELFARLATYYEQTGAITNELTALEKAMVPAVALATASNDTKNNKPIALLLAQAGNKLKSNHISEKANSAYRAERWNEAFVSYALLQYFNEMSAAWSGRLEQYTRDPKQDADWSRLTELPSKIIASSDGAAALSASLSQLGPIADRVRTESLFEITNYYILRQDSSKALQYAEASLPYLHLAPTDTPAPWDVALACDLAYALMLQRQLEAAVDRLNPCLANAKRLDNPIVLQKAHQVNIWVLQAVGRESDAQESVHYLLQQSPDDPQQYVYLAQVKAQRGDLSGGADAWRHAIALFEDQKNLMAAAAARISLANSPPNTPGLSSEERLKQINIAVALFRQLKNREGELSAEVYLANHYADQKQFSDAQAHHEIALNFASQLETVTYQAEILASLARLYETQGGYAKAAPAYEKAASIYHTLGDPAAESIQLWGLARELDALHRPDDAQAALLKAEVAADKSTNWQPRYWIRRYLASNYFSQGDFQRSIDVLQEAKQLSESADQPLPSAWARLALAAYLEIVGRMQDALDLVNAAVPVLQKYNDTDDVIVAYLEIAAIYGARESQLKDLDKALAAHRSAYDLALSISAEKAMLLNPDLIEIYWQMNRLKDAEMKANELLTFYISKQNEAGEAGALISLAEIQRSEGNLTAAAHALQQAGPLVARARDFYLGGRLLYGQANLYRNQGRLDEAASTYEQLVQLLEQFKNGSKVENRREVAETYGFIYDELIDTYYVLGTNGKSSMESAAAKAFDYAELNKARIFSSSWGLVLVDGLQKQVPAELREQERLLMSKRAALQAQMQDASSGGEPKLFANLRTSLNDVADQQAALVNKLRTVAPQYASVRYPQRVDMNAYSTA